MFICGDCGSTSDIGCRVCGHTPPVIDGIYQLTDDPDMVLDGGCGDYIGYESVGEAYEGRDWDCIKPEMTAACRWIAGIAGNGTVLDLGCGSGAYAVPLALLGVNVVCGDISNRMLTLLKGKALRNGCGMDRLIRCRINALSLPLADGSMACAIVNSVLHLIADPMKVIHGLHRVLAPGGRLILGVNSPTLDRSVTDEMSELNRSGYGIIQDFHKTYWRELAAKGISETRLNWNFDQFDACDRIFGRSEAVTIPLKLRRTTVLADGFLLRMRGKGFSDQQGVPTDAHKSAFGHTWREMVGNHGVGFGKTPITEILDGITLHTYIKT